MKINDKLTKNLVKQSELDSLNTYSTEEQQKGYIYINGSKKPYYEKTLFLKNLTIGTSATYTHGISNLEYIIGWNGAFYRKDGYNEPLPRNDNTSSWTGFIRDITPTVIYYYFGSSYTGEYAISFVILTLRYTKTTD